MVHKWLVI